MRSRRAQVVEVAQGKAAHHRVLALVGAPVSAAANNDDDGNTAIAGWYDEE